MSVSRDEMARRLGGATEAVTRRSFMQVLAASLALAGLEDCTRMPASHILPYVNQPELTPGVPQYYASSMVIDGFATGLLVESHDGRPTKVEGNPEHPASLGAAGVLEQASVLQLYDPDRARRVRRGRTVSTWDELAAALGPAQLGSQLGSSGAGLYLLLEPTSSPLEIELLDLVRERYAQAAIHFYAPLAAGTQPIVPQYDIEAADVIVALDADFLSDGPFHLRYARQFAHRRHPETGVMSRLYAMESSVTVTGNAADHRLALAPSDVTQVAAALLAAVQSGTPPDGSPHREWVSAVASDLRAHPGRSLIIAGPYTSPRTQSLSLQINSALGNRDRTVWFTRSPLIGGGDPRQSLDALIAALDAGDVRTLICAGGNPSYATAGALGFSSLLRRVPQSIYLGLYDNETARDCQWMVPAAHYLEQWGDARAYDGTSSIVQPLVNPVFGGRSLVELLAVLSGTVGARPYDLLRASWRRRDGGGDVDARWRDVLRRGVADGSAFPRETSPDPSNLSDDDGESSGGIQVLFRPHSRVRDGAFANNAWLQELPDPITTLTWDNAAYLSPSTAQAERVNTGDIVSITAGSRTVRMAALVVDGQADNTVTVQFGYGRDGGETVARGVGVDVYGLWPGDRFTLSGAALSRAGGAPRELAVTQPHRTLETTAPARVITIEELLASAPARPVRTLKLYQPPTSLPDGPAPQQWGMTIDLGACIGCGACMVACQAENNVPVVGRADVLRGREMHWLRIDWYRAPTAPDPVALAQPMLCQQCEQAPCEYVCPVEATVHSRDGLNEMVYNRCVGTRFCSNNCPYKVRRFNWIDYNANLSASEQLGKNPDVTVRERGVMEKCTFCVQRIRQAEISARVEHRPFTGREVQTACQQTCPTQAIVFGSLTDDGSAVVAARRTNRSYAVLEELGTGPRIHYLARVRNANPDLERGT